MGDKLEAIHNRLPLDAKIEPLALELRGIIRSRWADLTVQQRRALEAAETEMNAAVESIRTERKRKVAEHALDGAPPRYPRHIIEPL